MTLNETSFMIVTCYPHVEQKRTEAWFQTMILTLKEELQMNFSPEDISDVLGNSVDMQSKDFLALYSQTLTKAYNQLA